MPPRLQWILLVVLAVANLAPGSEAPLLVARDLGLPEPKFERKDVGPIIQRLQNEAQRLILAIAGRDIAEHSSVTVSATAHGGFHFVVSAAGAVLDRNEPQLRRLNRYVVTRYLVLCFAQDQQKAPASLEEFLASAAKEEENEQKRKPNQALLPTPTAVTPPAAQEPRQP